MTVYGKWSEYMGLVSTKFSANIPLVGDSYALRIPNELCALPGVL